MCTEDVDFTLREAKMEDLDTLLQFEQGIVQYERPFAPNIKEDPVSYYDISQLIQREDAQVIVVVSASGELIGSGYIKIKRTIPSKKPELIASSIYLTIASILKRHQTHSPQHETNTWRPKHGLIVESHHIIVYAMRYYLWIQHIQR